MENDIGGALIILILGIVVFLVLRMVTLWYWKINERLNEQRKTNILLMKMLSSMGDEKPNMIHGKLIDKGDIKEIDVDLWVSKYYERGVVAW